MKKVPVLLIFALMVLPLAAAFSTEVTVSNPHSKAYSGPVKFKIAFPPQAYYKDEMVDFRVVEGGNEEGVDAKIDEFHLQDIAMDVDYLELYMDGVSFAHNLNPSVRLVEFTAFVENVPAASGNSEGKKTITLRDTTDAPLTPAVTVQETASTITVTAKGGSEDTVFEFDKVQDKGPRITVGGELIIDRDKGAFVKKRDGSFNYPWSRASTNKYNVQVLHEGQFMTMIKVESASELADTGSSHDEENGFLMYYYIISDGNTVRYIQEGPYILNSPSKTVSGGVAQYSYPFSFDESGFSFDLVGTIDIVDYGVDGGSEGADDPVRIVQHENDVKENGVSRGNALEWVNIKRQNSNREVFIAADHAFKDIFPAGIAVENGVVTFLDHPIESGTKWDLEEDKVAPFYFARGDEMLEAQRRMVIIHDGSLDLGKEAAHFEFEPYAFAREWFAKVGDGGDFAGGSGPSLYTATKIDPETFPGDDLIQTDFYGDQKYWGKSLAWIGTIASFSRTKSSAIAGDEWKSGLSGLLTESSMEAELVVRGAESRKQHRRGPINDFDHLLDDGSMAADAGPNFGGRTNRNSHDFNDGSTNGYIRAPDAEIAQYLDPFDFDPVDGAHRWLQHIDEGYRTLGSFEWNAIIRDYGQVDLRQHIEWFCDAHREGDLVHDAEWWNTFCGRTMDYQAAGWIGSIVGFPSARDTGHRQMALSATTRHMTGYDLEQALARRDFIARVRTAEKSLQRESGLINGGVGGDDRNAGFQVGYRLTGVLSSLDMFPGDSQAYQDTIDVARELAYFIDYINYAYYSDVPGDHNPATQTALDAMTKLIKVDPVIRSDQSFITNFENYIESGIGYSFDGANALDPSWFYNPLDFSLSRSGTALEAYREHRVQGFSTCTPNTFTKADGTPIDLNRCSDLPYVCGDGNVEGGETCDDGNTQNGDGCSSFCQIEDVCGDGVLGESEQCDDGNLVDGDGCSRFCLTEAQPVCGNSIVESGEECDDGNLQSDDGCSSTCQIEPFLCGNGQLDPGEDCDDGNLLDGDGCSSRCVTEMGGETCLPEDVNGDDVVNVFDLLTIVSVFGTNDSLGDVTGDGVVNVFDLLSVAGKLGLTSSNCEDLCSNGQLDPGETCVDGGGSCGATCGQGEGCFDNDDCLQAYVCTDNVCSLPVIGSGLLGTYYNDIAFTEYVGEREDQGIDFDWGSGSPFPGVDGDTFSVHWTGQIFVPFTGTYTFYTVNNDGAELWVNGEKLIDDLDGNHGPTEFSGEIVLSGDSFYDIDLKFIEGQGTAVIRLLWESDFMEKEVIQPSSLFTSCTEGSTRSSGTSVGICEEFIEECMNGEWIVIQAGTDPFPEICNNGIDENCNGMEDDAPETFYLDSDGDSFGGSTTTLACDQPEGYSSNNLDCNDNDASINPGASDICSDEQNAGQDRNCDNVIDECGNQNAGSNFIAGIASNSWKAVPLSTSGTIRDHVPEYPYNIGNPVAITDAWNGGAYDPKFNRLIIEGGGHADYGGNEKYAFDVGTLTWSRIWGPSANIPRRSSSEHHAGPLTLPDGSPTIRHNYDGAEIYIDPVTGHPMFIVFSGSPWRASGGSSRDFWTLDLETFEWEQLEDAPGSQIGVGAASVVDPATGNFYAEVRVDARWYDRAARQWHTVNNVHGWSDDVDTGALNTDDMIMVIIGQGGERAYDLSNGMEKISFNPSGSGPGGLGPGFAYRPVDKKFYAWNGGSTMYTLDLAANAWNTVSANGDIPGSPPENGVLGKFRYIPDFDVFILVNDIDSNVYFYRP